MMQAGRVPQIQADAAYAIVTSDSTGFTGNMCIDEQVLRKAGVVRLKPQALCTRPKAQSQFGCTHCAL